jgi:hypothetical protein
VDRELTKAIRDIPGSFLPLLTRVSASTKYDAILDVDAIIGIERDEPVLSFPQRTLSTEIPEAPKKRDRETGDCHKRGGQSQE